MENKTKRLSGRLRRLMGKTVLAAVLAPALSLTGVLSVLPVAGESLTPLTVYAVDYSMVFTGPNSFTVSNNTTPGSKSSTISNTALLNNDSAWSNVGVTTNAPNDTLNIDLGDHNTTMGAFHYNGNVVVTGGTGSLTAKNHVNNGVAFQTGGNLTVKGGTVTGMQVPDGTSYAGSFTGIHVGGGLTVTGGGVSGTSYAEHDGVGIYAENSIQVSGGNVTGTGSGDSAGGIYSYGSIQVTGGNVIGTSPSIGVRADSSITMSDGELIGRGNSVGIQSYSGNIVFTGGKMTANATGNNSVGIYAMGDITFSGNTGRVEAKAAQGNAMMAQSISIKSPLIVHTPEGGKAYFDNANNMYIIVDADGNPVDYVIIQPPAPAPTPDPNQAPLPVPVDPALLFAQTNAQTGGSGSGTHQIWYWFSEGDGQTWLRGSGLPVLLTAVRSEENHKTFSLFTGVTIDGLALDKAFYTVEEGGGSVKLAISPALMEILPEGTHTIRAQFADGYAEGQITVQGALVPAS